MRFVCLLLLTVHAASGGAVTKPDKTLQQHLDNAALLERAGLNGEAEAEYLAALAVANPSARSQIVDALQRVQNAQLSALANEADHRSEKQLQIGKDFERHGQFDSALAAFQRAYREAGTQGAQTSAQVAIGDVLSRQHAFWNQYVRDWLEPVAIRILLLVLAALLLYWAARNIGRLRARYSRNIEILEFDDATDTGFGKAFPLILRTAYEQVLRVTATRVHSGLSAFRRPADLPIMVPPRYETLPEIGLSIAGVETSTLIRSLARLLQRAHFTVRGVVYRSGQEIRVASSVAQYNGAELEVRSDSVLWKGPGHVAAPQSAAYEVIAAILVHWNAETR